MTSKLDSIIESLNVFQNTFVEDVCIVVADTENIRAVLPGDKVKIPFKAGQSVELFKGTVSEIALRTGKRQMEERGPELLGFSYVTKAEPVFEGGKVIGVVGVISSLEKYENLRNEALSISETVIHMSNATGEVSDASNEVAASIQNLSEESSKMLESIQNIQGILQFVHEIATQSNLLGINAAIEAARAGQHGRGFGVVAGEIRKMAVKSKESAETIRLQLQDIQKVIENMNSSIHQIAASTEETSAGMEELHASFNHLSESAARIRSY
ncbi:methyl-accepting chemotaxis protein [Falsibacillus pallidus]|uniref:methyl-accepting chemotaxis protein n=1 Tax=Falsibacillus pallidus TaxID=493781 RepID=UPI003D954B18